MTKPSKIETVLFGKRKSPFTEQIKLAAEVIKQEIMNSIRFFSPGCAEWAEEEYSSYVGFS